MLLIEMMAKTLEKEQKNGSNSLILVFGIICFAIWGSFMFQKENVTRIDTRVTTVEQKINIIDKEVAVLKATR